MSVGGKTEVTSAKVEINIEQSCPQRAVERGKIENSINNFKVGKTETVEILKYEAVVVNV